MLQLFNIKKSYETAGFSQTALDDVSIAFRDNEFVAILGPSGSGKTTMLNIVGGLDHYDSGDLVVDGVSTKDYKDRDWDTYRNNRVGFVFQSYNLIPHQTVLANVELALTLSGVSKSERKQRAIEALQKVGLGDHVNKKPNQLSGGQMQRVAIARALINDPEILLADEPTGALDSKTSVQIMNLLTEIAEDRLVIMVTHNPELAEEYATRIVNLSDGNITADSDPFDPTQEGVSDKDVRKTSMSFFTALALSFNNLMTKKGRTIMTAFAGSIGIIGIAAILALANGVNNYIKSVEEETLSEYPLSIYSSGFDMTAMMVGMVDTDSSEDEKNESDVTEFKAMSSMFSGIGTNDLAALKEYIDSDESDMEEYTNTIQYSYDVTPQIYSGDTSDGVRQVNPDSSFSALGLGSSTSSNSLMSASMSTDIFFEMLDNQEMLETQYDVKAGRWPESYDEVILVLNSFGGISDYTLYVMGLRDPDELSDMVKQLANNEDIETPEDRLKFSYDEIMDVDFKLVQSSDYYEYDEEYEVWKDKTDDKDYMKELVNDGLDLKIVGVVQPSPEATASGLNIGINYTPALTQYLMDEAAKAEIVQKQIDKPLVNVFTGRTFQEEEDDPDNNGFDMGNLFAIDEEAITNAFKFDESALNIDPSGLNLSGNMDMGAMGNMDLPDMDFSGLDMSAMDMSADIDTDAASQQMAGMMSSLMGGFFAYYESTLPSIGNIEDYENPQDYFDALTQLGNAMSSSAITAEFTAYMSSPAVQSQMASAMEGMMSFDTSDMEAQFQAQLQTVVQSYIEQIMTSYMTGMVSEIEKQITAAMETMMTQLADGMENAFSFDEEAFADAFDIDMDETELTELIMALMMVEENTYDNNLSKLGYADNDKPSGIDIYPIDFESKAAVIDILDSYNERMEANGDEDKVVSYSDIVGTLMSSVTDIVNMVSYVLVAFVAISLVVSSIMIGIITYISVLERKKEIGILRSIGASKGDISRVFNAETLIVGFVSGTMGILITLLVTIPINAFVYAEFDVPNVALLPVNAAIILILISMFLSFIAGLMPSSAASRRDPVEALRSE